MAQAIVLTGGAGHPFAESLGHPAYQRLLRRAALWAVGKSDQLVEAA